MTALNLTPADHLRDTIRHAHADLRAAGKLVKRGRPVLAWRKIRQGYERLGKALEGQG